MLIGIKGGLGDGKTSVLTFIALRQFAAGQNVFANYKLNFPDGPGRLSEFKPENLVNGEWQGPGILCLDELQMWLESRISTSEFNRIGTQMVLQTRKKDTHIAYTTQFFDQVDLRIRRLTDVRIECRRKKDYSYLSFYKKADNDIYVLAAEKKLYLPPLYGLFDTKEIIRSLKDYGEPSPKKSKGKVDVPI